MTLTDHEDRGESLVGQAFHKAIGGKRSEIIAVPCFETGRAMGTCFAGYGRIAEHSGTAERRNW